MMKFRCFIEELSYLDVPSIRGPFTSFNRAGTSMSGLGSNEDWGPKSFKFNNCWLKHKDFSNFVDKEWRSFKVEVAVTELNDLNFQVSNPPFDALALKRDLAYSKICNYVNLKESLLRQKSRSLWLKDGDPNSSFFHKVMKERYIRNFISFVNSDDGRKENVDAIKSEMFNFFEFNFLEENMFRPKLNGVDLLKFSVEDRMSLEAVFMEEEIKAVVWSCNGNKSPGPDDFSLSFLHSCWETVKKNVFRFVQDFYSNSTLTKATTTSFLTLTPKIKNPQLLVNYRPIYLSWELHELVSFLKDIAPNPKFIDRFDWVLNDSLGFYASSCYDMLFQDLQPCVIDDDLAATLKFLPVGLMNTHSPSAAKPGKGIVVAVKKLYQDGFKSHEEMFVTLTHLIKK
ncbi:hypothetical protein KIW84_053902 [Lathyrus oleraceus]|uniref:Uncharacterized protein n=1 Tax=Pisum sativum TaxID=3888 RepID=A0A9D4WU75_PEA|nr:hypothetical protein KIW84_053902 [Pisum sativum]